MTVHFDTENTALWRGRQTCRDIKWNTPRQCWFLPLDRDHYRDLLRVIGGKARINDRPLRNSWNNGKAPRNQLPRLLCRPKDLSGEKFPEAAPGASAGKNDPVPPKDQPAQPA